ncbi:hypothetical protein [Streptomyces sp. H27-H5]|nr:hypothetical protein [Streptomyces sp. H27-H5]MCY0962085.1 hypothetical protein [Streptomyces sp. H27-H5]
MSHWSVYDGAAALKAARTLELIAQRTAPWPAHDAPPATGTHRRWPPITA